MDPFPKCALFHILTHTIFIIKIDDLCSAYNSGPFGS